MTNIFPSFSRKFSRSMYKNLKIKLGEMSFFKDFVNDTRGDLYPIRKRSFNCIERVEHNIYTVEEGEVMRMFCRHFPFATYRTTFYSEGSEAGFVFTLGNSEARITISGISVVYACGEHRETKIIPDGITGEEKTLIVSCRPGAFDIYIEVNGKPEHQLTVHEEAFNDSNIEKLFEESYVFLYASGCTDVKEVVACIDNGISIADTRPIKYENGLPILENGKMFFTASIRMQEGAFQGIFSWIPGTDEFDMTGAVFYDSGDGRWRNYLAPVMIYHREKKEWIVWVSSFEHKHILAYSSFKGDPRFGVNVIDVGFMDEAKEDSEISDFVGFKGDEDADLIYDEKTGRWLLAICRVEPKGSYVYVFFESKDPLRGFRYIGKGNPGSETGGSFVRYNDELFFICGNSYKERSEYRIYSKGGMELAKFNHPDGGFRGWGSAFPITMGSRTRYFWLTFDRHNGSSYPWSYGNLYCFEMTR